MASTITGTATSWTITSADGRAAGAAKNRASATLQIDGTVVIESDGGETLWAGDIMGLAGLAGANPAARFADLLNNFLTGSLPAPINSIAAGRFGIDPSSNPGPVIGGLLFDPTATTAGTFILPMIETPAGLGIGDNYHDDSDGYFTLTNPTTVTINVTGKYHCSMAWFILTNDTLGPVGVQLLKNGDAMFTSPPGLSSFMNTVGMGTTPISALYARAYLIVGAIDCALTAGDTISCKLYAEGGSGGNTAEISLTSALCIHLIGGTQAAAGTVGITAVNNQPSGGEVLVDNPGAGPVIGVKRLQSGTGISLTSNANEITIDATGGATVDNAADTGVDLVDTSGAPNYLVKRFKAGTNITLSSDATSVTVNSTGGGSGLGDNGFLVGGGGGITFPNTETIQNFATFGRNSGSLTWLTTVSSSITAGSTVYLDWYYTIDTASTGTARFSIKDVGTGEEIATRIYAPGFTGQGGMSIVFNKFGTSAIRAVVQCTQANGTYSLSFGAAESRRNWFSAQLLRAP